MTEEIKTRIFNYGDENEGTWPSRNGTGVRGHFRMRIGSDSSKPANISHGFIQDEMEPTKHPLTGEYYTSKAKFREVTKAHGYEEVGTAYENGYEPKPAKDENALTGKLINQLRERMNGTGSRRG